MKVHKVDKEKGLSPKDLGEEKEKGKVNPTFPIQRKGRKITIKKAEGI